MGRNVLITGGAGFIGSALSLKLIKEGYNVRVLDNLSEQIHGNNPEDSYTYNLINGKVEFIKGDVQTMESWTMALKDMDIVVHLAAETGTGQSMYEIGKYINVNVGGTAILLDILVNKPHTIGKVIVASSRSVYGEGKYSCPDHGDVYPNSRNESDLLRKDFECKCPKCGTNVKVDATHEEAAIKPSSVYAISKFNQEQLILAVCKSVGIDGLAFRFQNVFGPGQSLANPYTGIISIFSNLLRQNREVQIFEDGEESRDFVYIDDVVEAIHTGIRINSSLNLAINIGSGVRTSVMAVASQLKKTLNSDSNLKITGNFRLGDIRHNFADLEIAGKYLGYSPSVTFSEGLASFSDWVSGRGIQQIRFDESLMELRAKKLLK